MISQFSERILAFFAVRLLWKSNSKKGEAIQSFQATEADGVWHLFRGIKKEQDPRTLSHLFSHIIEEQAHADMFAKTFRQEIDQPFQHKTVERADIYDNNEPSWKHLVYVHIGEIEAVSRFSKLIDYLPNSPLKSTLTDILKDEEGHVNLTMDSVIGLNVPAKKVKKELRKVKIRRLKEAWLRTGARGVDQIANLILSIIYYLVLGPCLFIFARKKIKAERITYDNNHMKAADI
ncbi:MAG: hypothetical protein CME65_11580 [Halobacteriovoraceae bacterium]|nr:hypothetical protein [Halobacteriovoraceae bacterium]|tara:strand:- start:25369 stop:26070 length:702 start_codon:yes stop_codon:yes gene_type:complete